MEKLIQIVKFMIFFGLIVLGQEVVDELIMTSITEASHWNKTMFWGTYRPNLYFGLKTRSSNPFLTGLMWHVNQENNPKSFENLRHSCEQGDHMKRYGWLRHDGISFGDEEILDPTSDLNLTISFVKGTEGSNGGDWGIHLNGKSLSGLSGTNAPSISLFLYFGSEEPEAKLSLIGSGIRKGIQNTAEIRLDGTTEELGQFSIFVKEDSKNTYPRYTAEDKQLHKGFPDLKYTYYLSVNSPHEDIWKVKDLVKSELREDSTETFMKLLKSRKGKGDVKFPIIIPTLPNTYEKGDNLYIFQKVLQLPFALDIVFVSNSAHENQGKKIKVNEIASSMFEGELSSLLKRKREEFETKFENVFQLKKKGFSSNEIKFAMATFSNLIGGLGYFHGNSLAQYTPEAPPSMVSPQSLFTAVPSRPFFPRGFLWDEGFHQMIISKWDKRITIDVLKHWFNLMSPDGWIAREQILGAESRSKVPTEFQVQHPTHANPPTLLLVLENILHDLDKAVGEEREQIINFFNDIFPAIKKWYSWYLKNQQGIQPNTFRWRGRTENHTLSSGLDDYPRNRIPSDGELHVDLACWMTKFAQILSSISNKLQMDDSATYRKKYRELEKQLDSIHWNSVDKVFSDVTYEEEQKYFVTHKGYVSLFPFLLGFIPKDSPKLSNVLQMLKDPQHLWSKFGILSLSKSDPYFGTGENYWKGPIWININYLILQSLHNHYIKDGPYSEEARNIYNELRSNIVENMFKNYQKTGFIWEQYNPTNGQGQRSHPFTGWSSLVVLIMAEIY